MNMRIVRNFIIVIAVAVAVSLAIIFYTVSRVTREIVFAEIVSEEYSDGYFCEEEETAAIKRLISSSTPYTDEDFDILAKMPVITVFDTNRDIIDKYSFYVKSFSSRQAFMIRETDGMIFTVSDDGFSELDELKMLWKDFVMSEPPKLVLTSEEHTVSLSAVGGEWHYAQTDSVFLKTDVTPKTEKLCAISLEKDLEVYCKELDAPDNVTFSLYSESGELLGKSEDAKELYGLSSGGTVTVTAVWSSSSLRDYCGTAIYVAEVRPFEN